MLQVAADAELAAPRPEVAATMTKMAERFRRSPRCCASLEVARSWRPRAIDEMANSRLQAEQWWMAAGERIAG